MPHPSGSKTPIKNTTVTATIEKLVHGGEGLARLEDGKIIFASSVASGDKISGLVKKKSGRLLIESPEVLEPSAERVTPECQHASVCGGCDWQHIETPAQQRWKQNIVEESLTRLGKIESPNISNIISDASWEYRHTVTWNVANIDGVFKLSYFEQNSRTPVCFEECPVLAKPLKTLSEWLNTQQTLLATVTQVKARCNKNGDILAGFAWKSNATPAEENLNEWFNGSMVSGAFAMGQSSTNNDVENNDFSHVWGKETLADEISGKTFTFGLSHFMQVNPAMTDMMVSEVKKEVDRLSEAKSVLELYCGIGILGLSALNENQHLIGVEGSDIAIDFADLNAAQLGIKERTHFDAIDVEAHCEVSEQPFDIAICDPPRNGIKPEVLAWLSEYITDTIIYVSCNPATLARDCRQLAESGFRLERVQPLDLFPQTSHIEAIAVLKKQAD